MNRDEQEQRIGIVRSNRSAPIMEELLRYELLASSEEMLYTLRRTTRSILAREGADYGAAMLNAQGEIVAQAVPYGFVFFEAAVPLVAQQYRQRFQPGDVIISNDPYGGLSHLPDIVVIVPIFWDGVLAGFRAVAQHHTDIGGRFPGGNGVASESIYEEGLRLPAIKLYEAGKLVESVQQIIEANVRAPDDVIGDILAAVAACNKGKLAMERLYRKYGQREIAAYCDRMADRSERHVRDLITSFPDGTYRATGQFSDETECVVDVIVTMTVTGDELVFDLTGTSPQVQRAYNVPSGTIVSMPVHVLLGFLGDLGGASLNSGLLRPIRVIAPEGSVANPRFPAPVASRNHVYNRIVQACRDCLAQVAPDRMPAAGEGYTGAVFISPGAHATKQFRLLTEFYASGWGARPDKDGVDGVMGMMLSGFKSSSGEVTESETAVALDGFGFVPDSAGPGKYRGSPAVFRRWRFLDHTRVLVRDLLPGTAHRGRAGGGNSSMGRVVRITSGGETVLDPRSLHDLEMIPGDVLEYSLPSGAGFGDPFERDPESVLVDVLDGKVSIDAAEVIYGVVIDTSSRVVDAPKTQQLRQRAGAPA